MSDQYFDFPWSYRFKEIGKLKLGHPKNISQFRDWKIKGKLDKDYLAFLEVSNDFLLSKWIKAWDSFFVVGPFINRERRYDKIPFIAIINEGNIYSHLLVLSKRLSGVYLQFGIMPDLFILTSGQLNLFKEKEDRRWLSTEDIAIELKRNS